MLPFDLYSAADGLTHQIVSGWLSNNGTSAALWRHHPSRQSEIHILGGSIYRIAATFSGHGIWQAGSRESETGIGTGAQERDTDLDNA
jgi:hypothetical protein